MKAQSTWLREKKVWLCGIGRAWNVAKRKHAQKIGTIARIAELVAGMKTISRGDNLQTQSYQREKTAAPLTSPRPI